MGSNLCSIKTTLPNSWREFEVVSLAQELLESGAACIHHHQITSTYKWEGEIHSGNEWSVEIKVSHPNKDSVLSKLQSVHPYDVPKITCLDLIANDSYYKWVDSQ